MNLSVNTVKSYLREMMHKLAARNQARTACCEQYVSKTGLATSPHQRSLNNTCVIANSAVPG
ncbi:hypothetical protein [Streptomyces pseudoechinosporeus]